MTNLTKYLTNFYKKYLQNLKPYVKNFGQYSMHLDIVHQEHGQWGFTDKPIPLGVKKVICQHSLKTLLK